MTEASYRKKTLEREVRYVLEQDRAASPAPVWVLLNPGAREWAEFQNGLADQQYTADVVAVERFVARLEGHPDAAALGAPGSKERAAYVDALPVKLIKELALEIAALAWLGEPLRKNSDSPSASSGTPGGDDAAAG